MTTKIEEIARWVESVKFDDIPTRVLDRARYQILNIIAAAHAGNNSPAAQKLIKAVKKRGNSGKFPVVGGDFSTSLRDSLFVNTALSMAHDYDDYLFMGHTGHSSVFASLLIGSAEKKSLRDVIAAQVIANEIGGRLGAACVIGPQNGQMWTFIHVAETAAIAAKLMGLDAKGIANAISIGLYQPPFALTPGFMGPDTKILSAAQGIVAGLTAAELAREGFTGPLDILENPRGFLAQFSFAPLEFMLTGWGKSWVTDSLAYKTVPGCAYIDTTVDAMKTIIEDFRKKNGRDLAPEDVREITVQASLLTIGMNHLSEDVVRRGVLNPIAINFSVPANVAILILTGDLRVDYLDPDWLDLHSEDILALCRRTKIEHDWEMTLGVAEAIGGVIDFGRVADHVGMTTLLGARRKAAAHFGAGVSLGLKDFFDMRKKAGDKGKEYVGRIASGAFKKLIGGKSAVGRAHPPDLGESDFSKISMPFAARVILKTVDWKEYSARRDIPNGAPGKPWEDTIEKVKEKFRRETSRRLSASQIQWAIQNISSVENAGSSEDLIGRLFIGDGSEKSPSKIVHHAVEPERKPEKHRKRDAAVAAEPEKKLEKQPERHEVVQNAGKKAPDDVELPPIIFEPIKPRPERKPAEQAPAAAPAREAAPKPPTREIVSKRQDKNKKSPAPNVTLRRAGRREKAPRPPKGAKRRRMSRP